MAFMVLGMVLGLRGSAAVLRNSPAPLRISPTASRLAMNRGPPPLLVQPSLILWQPGDCPNPSLPLCAEAVACEAAPTTGAKGLRRLALEPRQPRCDGAGFGEIAAGDAVKHRTAD